VESDSLALDMRAVGELREIMGEDFPLLIDTFVRDSEMRLADLHQSLADGDNESFRRAAHSFKGSAGNLGAKQLTEVCRQLELAGSENRLQDAQPLLEKLAVLYPQAEQALRRMC
jgi:HPt (histidine-containing phosphotransfer) domain-containing protein